MDPWGLLEPLEWSELPIYSDLESGALDRWMHNSSICLSGLNAVNGENGDLQLCNESCSSAVGITADQVRAAAYTMEV